MERGNVMEVEFHITTEDFKNSYFLYLNQINPYKSDKILTSLVFSLILLFYILISRGMIWNRILVLSFLSGPWFLLIGSLIVFIVIFSLNYFLLYDFLIKALTHLRYFFKSKDRPVKVTVVLNEQSFVYKDKRNQYEVPWDKIDKRIDHPDFILLYVEAIGKYFIIKREPFNLNKEETEQFNEVIQTRTLEY